jgi:hypothetical protein
MNDAVEGDSAASGNFPRGKLGGGKLTTGTLVS